MFAYCGNNPIIFVDPTGLRHEKELDLVALEDWVLEQAVEETEEVEAEGPVRLGGPQVGLTWALISLQLQLRLLW